MADVRLPDALRAAIDGLLAGAPGGSGSAVALSDAYRSMLPSSRAVAGARDVRAYLTTRLPATYAATAKVLAETVARLPDFAPGSLLDAGSGPGTASWAAAEAYPGLASVTMLDSNRHLLAAAGELTRGSDSETLRTAELLTGSLSVGLAGARRFSLVVASYALTELADRQVVDSALSLWASCAGVLVIVEPGRTRDYERLMAIREAVIAAGGRVVAPCPHDSACPLPEGDWCHFSVRLPRTRAHMQAKGGTLGYEDEKFSYLVMARPSIGGGPAIARVIRPPVVRKFEVELSVCGRDGLAAAVAPKRDAAAYKAARKLDWGDVVV